MTHETYEVPALRQIVMVQDWRAIFWLQGTHATWAIHALALGTKNPHNCETGTLHPRLMGWTAEEDWEIFGLEYSISEGWHLVDDMSNFCGLLPPEETLLDFEQHGRCVHPHPCPDPGTAVRPESQP